MNRPFKKGDKLVTVSDFKCINNKNWFNRKCKFLEFDGTYIWVIMLESFNDEFLIINKGTKQLLSTHQVKPLIQPKNHLPKWF